MKYPIDIESRMTVMRRELKDELAIRLMCAIYDTVNFAYSLGEAGEYVPANVIAWIQCFAIDPVGCEMTFRLMRWVSEAHAQGRRDAAELEEYYGQAD